MGYEGLWFGGRLIGCGRETVEKASVLGAKEHVAGLGF